MLCFALVFKKYLICAIITVVEIFSTTCTLIRGLQLIDSGGAFTDYVYSVR